MTIFIDFFLLLCNHDYSIDRDICKNCYTKNEIEMNIGPWGNYD